MLGNARTGYELSTYGDAVSLAVNVARVALAQALLNRVRGGGRRGLGGRGSSAGEDGQGASNDERAELHDDGVGCVRSVVFEKRVDGDEVIRCSESALQGKQDRSRHWGTRATWAFLLLSASTLGALTARMRLWGEGSGRQPMQAGVVDADGSHSGAAVPF